MTDETPSPHSPALGPSARRMAVLAMVVASFTAFSTASELGTLFELSERRQFLQEKLDSNADVQPDTRLATEFAIRKLSVAASMKGSRIAVLFLLAGASMVVFGATARYLRPFDTPRERYAKLVGRAALAVAVLRAVDGAQWTALVRIAGKALSEKAHAYREFEALVKKLSEEQQGLDLSGAESMLLSLLERTPSYLSAIWTVVVCALFIGLWRYFDSKASPPKTALPQAPRG